MTTSDHPSRGIFLMMLAVLFIAGQEALAKYLAASGIPMAQVIWARYAGHLCLMLVIFLPQGGLGLLRSNNLPAQIGRSLLLLIDTGLYFFGLIWLSLVEVTALVFTAPILVVLLARPLLGERVGRSAWAATLAGFIGVLIIVRPPVFGLGGGTVGTGESGLGWPALLILAAALVIALFNITTRRMRTVDQTGTTMIYTALVGVVISSVVVPFFWTVPTGSQLFLMVLLGLAGGCGHALLILAHQISPASTVAPFMYVQIIWALGLGWVVFADLPDLLTMLGSAIIIASGLILWIRQKKGELPNKGTQ